jgi:hypothetical protein
MGISYVNNPQMTQMTQMIQIFYLWNLWNLWILMDGVELALLLFPVIANCGLRHIMVNAIRNSSVSLRGYCFTYRLADDR